MTPWETGASCRQKRAHVACRLNRLRQLRGLLRLTTRETRQVGGWVVQPEWVLLPCMCAYADMHECSASALHSIPAGVPQACVVQAGLHGFALHAVCDAIHAGLCYAGALCMHFEIRPCKRIQAHALPAHSQPTCSRCKPCVTICPVSQVSRHFSCTRAHASTCMCMCVVLCHTCMQPSPPLSPPPQPPITTSTQF